MLYVNGDSHTAGTYLTTRENHDECFAGLLAKKMKCQYLNEAMAGGSNARIIRTSKEYLRKNGDQDTIVLIGWSHPIRTEWFIDGEWLQIAPGELYEVNKDPELHDKWQDYINTLWDSKFDSVNLNRAVEHQYMIADFSKWLYDRGMKHLFFHGHNSFFYKKNVFEIEWTRNPWLKGKPYDPNMAFCNYSESRGHVADQWYHFSMEAHKDYADFIETELSVLRF